MDYQSACLLQGVPLATRAHCCLRVAGVLRKPISTLRERLAGEHVRLFKAWQHWSRPAEAQLPMFNTAETRAQLPAATQVPQQTTCLAYVITHCLHSRSEGAAL